MLLVTVVGAISVTIATLFSLIAMCMFFNTDAKIRFAVIASYLILVLVIVSVVVTVIRWLQVLINTGRLGRNTYCHKNKRKFRIAFIVLGTICVILALFSTIVIFIFAKKLDNISIPTLRSLRNKNASDSDFVSNNLVTNAMNKITSAPTVDGEDDWKNELWYNETCTDNPDGKACKYCKPCANRKACDVCERRWRTCKACKCNPDGDPVDRPLINCSKLQDQIIVQPTEPENDISTEPARNQDAVSGVPAEDSPCKDRKGTIRQGLCSIYELTNSWHCKNEPLLQRVDCILAVVGEGVTKRNIVAGLLIVSIVGHLVNIGVAIWCPGEIAQSSEEGYEYRPQSDDNDDKDEEKEKENGEKKTDEKEAELQETVPLTEEKI